jgi:hypothetical protein
LPNKFQRDIVTATDEGAIVFVKSGLAEARQQLQSALKNLNSAELLRDTDVSGSFTLTYEASRKSVGAVLAANGMRLKHVEEAHKVFVAISKLESFDSEAWVKFDWMRVRRNDTQYSNPDKPDVTSEDCDVAIQAAKLMTDDAQRQINAMG